MSKDWFFNTAIQTYVNHKMYVAVEIKINLKSLNQFSQRHTWNNEPKTLLLLLSNRKWECNHSRN